MDGRGQSTETDVEEERHHTCDDTDCGTQQQDHATQAKQLCRRHFFLLNMVISKHAEMWMEASRITVEEQVCSAEERLPLLLESCTPGGLELPEIVLGDLLSEV